jgi:hypothetical protein
LPAILATESSEDRECQGKHKQLHPYAVRREAAAVTNVENVFKQRANIEL